MKRLVPFLFLLGTLLLGGCAAATSRETPAIQGTVLAIEPDRYAADEAMSALLAPYAAEVERLRVPIGFAPKRMEGRRANGELACWMADVVRDAAEHALGEHVDAAFVNAGGIRDILREGTVTEETMLTIMPFENRIVVFTLTGEQLRELATVFAQRRGFFPVSGMTIHYNGEGSLLDFTINSAPARADARYRVATSNYLADGGDRMTILQSFDAPADAGLTIRDAMIAHARHAHARGSGVVAPADLDRYQREGGTSE